MKYWGKGGRFLGGFWSYCWSRFFWVPPIGPVLVDGHCGLDRRGLENAGVVGGLSIVTYEDRYKGGPVTGSCSWNFPLRRLRPKRF